MFCVFYFFYIDVCIDGWVFVVFILFLVVGKLGGLVDIYCGVKGVGEGVG